MAKKIPDALFMAFGMTPERAKNMLQRRISHSEYAEFIPGNVRGFTESPTAASQFNSEHLSDVDDDASVICMPGAAAYRTNKITVVDYDNAEMMAQRRGFISARLSMELGPTYKGNAWTQIPQSTYNVLFATYIPMNSIAYTHPARILGGAVDMEVLANQIEILSEYEGLYAPNIDQLKRLVSGVKSPTIILEENEGASIEKIVGLLLQNMKRQVLLILEAMKMPPLPETTSLKIRYGAYDADGIWVSGQKAAAGIQPFALIYDRIVNHAVEPQLASEMTAYIAHIDNVLRDREKFKKLLESIRKNVAMHSVGFYTAEKEHIAWPKRERRGKSKDPTIKPLWRFDYEVPAMSMLILCGKKNEGAAIEEKRLGAPPPVSLLENYAWAGIIPVLIDVRVRDTGESNIRRTTLLLLEAYEQSIMGGVLNMAELFTKIDTVKRIMGYPIETRVPAPIWWSRA